MPMEGYKMTKVLNNNVVIAKENEQEVVLVGKAIGFDYKKGDFIQAERIESIFIKKSEEIQENYNMILETIDSKVVGISEEIIAICEKELGIELNSPIHISLADHINFALRREEQGVKIENPFLHELSVIYPKEYKLGSKAVEVINARFGVNLTEDEAGFICLHIQAAKSNKEAAQSLAYTRKVGEIMELIKLLLKKNLDKNSLQYARTLTHINFMLERVMSGKTIKNHLLQSIQKEMYNEYNLAIKVGLKIESLFSIKVPEDEIGYMALHLRRLIEV